MSYGGGGSVVTMPTTPWPASLEVRTHHTASASTNPFTKQQQIYDWDSGYMELSVSMPPMTKSRAADWIAFLVSCSGITNVFQFPAAVAAAFPESLTSDGTAQRYWRLKSNDQQWSIKRGQIYGLTFECREAT